MEDVLGRGTREREKIEQGREEREELDTKFIEDTGEGKGYR